MTRYPSTRGLGEYDENTFYRDTILYGEKKRLLFVVVFFLRFKRQTLSVSLVYRSFHNITIALYLIIVKKRYVRVLMQSQILTIYMS